MVFFAVLVPGKVNRLESVCLIACSRNSLVYFPRLISVPKGPFTIGDSKLILEAFTKSPFGRMINDFERVMQILKGNVIQCKEGFLVFCSFQLEKMLAFHVNDDLTLAKECVGISTHFWFIFRIAINIEARLLHEVESGSETNAEHIGLSTSNVEVVVLIVEGQ